MALTQSARLPGWDEEVVPALRKRLETESRTLARRMSAISLSESLEDQSHTFPSLSTSTPKPKTAVPSQTLISEAADTPRQPRLMPPKSSVRNNDPSKHAMATTYRARTYSQPYNSGRSGANSHSRSVKSTMQNGSRKTSAESERLRAISPKPTRIPKASKTYNSIANGLMGNAGHSPIIPSTNGKYASAHTTPRQSYDLPGGLPSSVSSRSMMNFPLRNASNLLHESPPFIHSTGSVTSSLDGSHSAGDHASTSYTEKRTAEPESHEEVSPRLSTDSEERPFQHWYRGDVSRNGGVGELRVGRRQELLQIANYGHTMAQKSADKRVLLEERRRKRADSIAGITDRDRELERQRELEVQLERERGSLYLDDEPNTDIGRVLDESPLTDLEGDGNSDLGSGSDYHYYSNEQHFGYAIGDGPGAIDAPVTAETTFESMDEEDHRMGDDMRNITPTPTMINPVTSSQNTLGRPPSRQDTHLASPQIPPDRPPSRQTQDRPPSRQTLDRPASRQTQNGQQPPPSRIPQSRRSSESRVATSSANQKSQSELPTSSSSSSRNIPPKSKSPSPPPGTPSLQTPTSNGKKRGVSPASTSTSKKSRTAASKATRARLEQEAARKQEVRGSVAYYPTPAEGDMADMADAIPSWTQPKPMTGNWDEVVLPVVARKKGLDEHYEQADGSPQPKKPKSEPLAPAPGTFGFNHSKYRPPHQDIPMDEFGRVNEDQQVKPTEVAELQSEPNVISVPPTSNEAPFSDYAPTEKVYIRPAVRRPVAVAETQVQGSADNNGHSQGKGDDDDGGAGCCKCVIM